MTEALNVQDQFEVNYRQALSGEYPDVVTKAIPRDALAMLERFFLDSLSDEDLAKLKALMANNVAIEVSKQIVKQEVDKKKAEKAREFELAPIFVYIQDVTSVKMADIRESQLSVPAGYKLLTRR